MTLSSVRKQRESYELLSENQCRNVLTLMAWVEKSGIKDNRICQQILSRFLKSQTTSEEMLWEWIEKQITGNKEKVTAKTRTACKQYADDHVNKGIWVCKFISGDNADNGCPAILFGYGQTSLSIPFAAVFNSRKPRMISPHAPWLESLRAFFQQTCTHSYGFVSSIGTFTYDLVTAHAFKHSLPLVTVLPFPLMKAVDQKKNGHSADSNSAMNLLSHPEMNRTDRIFLSCGLSAIHCPKKTRMICRDRILAQLSDVHVILEIRSGGNLSEILKKYSVNIPKTHLFIEPEKEINQTENITKNQEYVSQNKNSENHSDQLHHIDWNKYLFHYTRSCSGPWPGQSYEDYLNGFLENEPLARHTALDTLIRILTEQKLRAGNKLIRGKIPVISWSSIYPGELNSIRLWNPALTRWTVEPYGIAIEKKFLISKGCMPVIYGRDEIFKKLQPSLQYRFQRHVPPKCLWKHEKEWRLAQDLDLQDVFPGKGFIFVQSQKERDYLKGFIKQSDTFILIIENLSFEKKGQAGY